MSKTEIYLYGARDTSTGKLVSDITNPKRKYWDRKGNAEKAIEYYNRAYANRRYTGSNKGEHGTLELVTFKLVEAEDEPTLDQPCTNLRPTQEQGYRKQSVGEWVEVDTIDDGWTRYRCSICDWNTGAYYKEKHDLHRYCPNCGARMKGGE